MKKVITLCLLCLVMSCIQQQTPKNSNSKAKSSPSKENTFDFDESQVGYKRAEDVALGVIDFLKYKDTTAYLKLAIPLEVQKYVFQNNFEYRPDIKNKKIFIDSLTKKNSKRIANFLVRSDYIHKIMKEDKAFDITEAEIIQIKTNPIRIKDYGDFDRPIVANWKEVTVVMTYKNETYFFEIPQIIEQKGKWFLYYPEFYLRDQKEKRFIDNYLETKNKKADAFLH